MSNNNTRKRLQNDVDCELAKRSIWLVKVPRYLSEMWQANEGNVVGKLCIGQQVGISDFS